MLIVTCLHLVKIDRERGNGHLMMLAMLIELKLIVGLVCCVEDSFLALSLVIFFFLGGV